MHDCKIPRLHASLRPGLTKKRALQLVACSCGQKQHLGLALHRGRARLMPERCRGLVQCPNQPRPTAADTTDADGEKARAFYHHNHPPSRAGLAPRGRSLFVFWASCGGQRHIPTTHHHRTRFVLARLESYPEREGEKETTRGSSSGRPTRINEKRRALRPVASL